MRLINKKTLEKLKLKNRGNTRLIRAIERLESDIDENNWKSREELYTSRPDADCVHNDGFYFFNIAVHRTMIMVEFDESEASVVWVGNHSEYELVFKNNKSTIRRWLKFNDWI